MDTNTTTLATRSDREKLRGKHANAGKAPLHHSGAFLLSYKIGACHADRMNHEPNWKDRTEAANYWLATAVVAGAFVAGLIAAIRYLTG